jgi:hypothetical protein
MTEPDKCACCGAAMTDLETFRTCDGRSWCPDHGPLAIGLEREAIQQGGEFHMPGPMLLWVRKQVQKNNRRRFGP